MLRVKEKLNSIEDGSHIDGIVITTPYYFVSPQKEIKAYFEEVAGISKYPVYLYDLPGVTKIKITSDTVFELVDNNMFAGIKTADIALCKEIKNKPDLRDDFSVLCSALDIFDVAYTYGITKNLDGMFSCTPKNTYSCYSEFAAGNFMAGLKYLGNIISLRNLFIENGVFPSFTVAMNQLGYEGSFNPDYMIKVNDEAKVKIIEKLKEIGEI